MCALGFSSSFGGGGHAVLLRELCSPSIGTKLNLRRIWGEKRLLVDDVDLREVGETVPTNVAVLEAVAADPRLLAPFSGVVSALSAPFLPTSVPYSFMISCGTGQSHTKFPEQQKTHLIPSGRLTSSSTTLSEEHALPLVLA
jgi:hypothetical protein